MNADVPVVENQPLCSAIAALLADFDVATSLRQSPPFQVLPDDVLTPLTTAAQYHIYHRGELSLDAAKAVARVYVVLQGRVGFYRLDPAGHKLMIHTVRDGDVFWFMSPEWADGAKGRTEVLHEQTILCSLAWSKVQHLMLTYPLFTAALFTELARATADIADRLGEWVHPAVATRLAHTLAKSARADANQMVTETHEELAELIGASRATVTTELQRLRAAGLITSYPHRHGLYVPHPECLEAPELPLSHVR